MIAAALFAIGVAIVVYPPVGWGLVLLAFGAVAFSGDAARG